MGEGMGVAVRVDDCLELSYGKLVRGVDKCAMADKLNLDPLVCSVC
jgi:hypothetical protein